ncbi:MAG TPA: Uma2 family endonuclease [Thermomicrobiales bacterium]|nr:Uma2 family endonuclease [Thermomicrobiales bacterium]
MLRAFAPHRSITFDEYLVVEDTSSTRHEFVGGSLHALAGASDRHNHIALNIATRLHDAADAGPCRVYMSEMKVSIFDETVYYPDVMVTCDPSDTNPYVKSKPCLVVEVLSPSTATTDLREKLMEYRRLLDLKAYLVVVQDEMRVIRHWRDAEGAWWQVEHSGEDRVPLPCPEGFSIALSDIYRNVDMRDIQT